MGWFSGKSKEAAPRVVQEESAFDIAGRVVLELKGDNKADQTTSVLEKEGQRDAYLQRPAEDGLVKTVMITKDPMGAQFSASIGDNRWKSGLSLPGYKMDLSMKDKVELCFENAKPAPKGEITGLKPRA